MSGLNSFPYDRGSCPRTFSQVECVQWESKVSAVRVKVAVDARLRAVLRVVGQANERVEIPMLLCHLESSRNLVVRDYVGRTRSATCSKACRAGPLTEDLDHLRPNRQVVLAERADVRSVGVLEGAVRKRGS